MLRSANILFVFFPLFLWACGGRYPRSVLPPPESATSPIQLKQVAGFLSISDTENLLASDVRKVSSAESELRSCVAFLFARPQFRSSKLDVVCVNPESNEEILKIAEPAALSDAQLRDILESG